jgi:AcrR family transcriptional regulator
MPGEAKVNKPGRSVRPPAAHALSEALVHLVLEKRFEAITVQQLLDRAAVGRTTFYQRFRGKDDLLRRSFAQMLAHMDQRLERDGPGSGRVAPVRELFRHVREYQSFHRALGRSRKLDDLYEIGVDCFRTRIAARLPGASPLVATGYAGALMALLRWWVDHGMQPSPEEMDDLFHGMVRGTSDVVAGR